MWRLTCRLEPVPCYSAVWNFSVYRVLKKDTRTKSTSLLHAKAPSSKQYADKRGLGTLRTLSGRNTWNPTQRFWVAERELQSLIGRGRKRLRKTLGTHVQKYKYILFLVLRQAWFGWRPSSLNANNQTTPKRNRTQMHTMQTVQCLQTCKRWCCKCVSNQGMFQS